MLEVGRRCAVVQCATRSLRFFCPGGGRRHDRDQHDRQNGANVSHRTTSFECRLWGGHGQPSDKRCPITAVIYTYRRSGVNLRVNSSEFRRPGKFRVIRGDFFPICEGVTSASYPDTADSIAWRKAAKADGLFGVLPLAQAVGVVHQDACPAAAVRTPGCLRSAGDAQSCNAPHARRLMMADFGACQHKSQNGSRDGDRAMQHSRARSSHFAS